jgi:pimeloyl-ACP methyl ester carboxylesterase
MASRPRVGYAFLNQTSRLHVPVRYLPIIVIPGIMGTRLTDPKSDALVWNPVGAPVGDSPGPFACNVDRLMQISADLVPDETHRFEEASKNDEVAHIKHYFHLIPEFYDRMVKELAALTSFELGGEDVRLKVYCCGYDWRQDNARSALRLAEVVEEALAETRERKVLIVAHSMGGLVARYYCRVLGGESKVHQLFLIGSPSLGSPAAYLQLKNGLTGFYLKDVKDDLMEDSLDARGATVELIDSSGRLLSAVGGAVTGMSWGALKNFFGDIYLVMSLGAGRLLSRKESTYFTRQLTSLYQLLPSALYCRDHQSWLIFDPLATGYVPTGKMLVLPTLFDAALGFAGGALDFFSASQAIGTAMKADVEKFLVPEASERTSGRTTRNMETLATAFSRVGEALGSGEVGKTFEAFSILSEIYDRGKTTFIDARSNTQVYSDIYTGFLDVVEQRALTAMNLSLAYRFDQALTVRPRPEPGKSAMDLLKAILEPIGAAWMPILSTTGNAIAAFFEEVWDWMTFEGYEWTQNFDEREKASAEEAKKEKDEEDKKKADADAEAERTKPRAYIHPRTVNLYCESFPVDAGCYLLPVAAYSNDDANVVKWIMIPHYVAAFLPFLNSGPGTSSIERSAWGDGTVPVASANPGPGVFSCEPLLREAVPGVVHGGMLNEMAVVARVVDRVIDLVRDVHET